MMSSPKLLLGVLVVLLAAGTASADSVHLTNGGVVEGKARRVGQKVIVETPAGTLELAASEVRKIVVGRTRHDRYVERRDALAAAEAARDKLGGADTADADNVKSRSKSADAHVALGDWCKSEGLATEARRHWRRAVELSPDHRAAHGRLDHVRHDGRWMTESEYYKARGFVRRKGAWVQADDVERADRERKRKLATRAHQRKIESCVRRMSSMKRKKRLLAKVELQEYAEGRGDLRLAAFASRVAEHYNDQWRQVRLQLSRGRVLTEVRATTSRLKRPIQEIQTSLGANSTPVRIQLPELAIASIKTTVLIPADIQLDEDD